MHNLANTAMRLSNYPYPEKNKLSIFRLTKSQLKKIITKGFCFSRILNDQTHLMSIK